MTGKTYRIELNTVRSLKLLPGVMGCRLHML